MSTGTTTQNAAGTTEQVTRTTFGQSIERIPFDQAVAELSGHPAAIFDAPTIERKLRAGHALRTDTARYEMDAGAVAEIRAAQDELMRRRVLAFRHESARPHLTASGRRARRLA